MWVFCIQYKHICLVAIATNASAKMMKYICLIKRLALHDPLFVKVICLVV